MKAIEITASYGRTVQLGEFEPVNFHASIKIGLEGGDVAEKAYELGFRAVKNVVDAEIANKLGERAIERKAEREADKKDKLSKAREKIKQ